MASDSYSFGDSDPAAERLRLLARVFSTEIQQFLRSSAPTRPQVAVDMGCGPGHTTRLLGEVLGAGTLIGVDFSARLIEIAVAESRGQAQFVCHDVTIGPLPFGPADVLFTHLLLSHIANPGAALTAWAPSLAEGGVILVDEVESVETTQALFREYLRLVERAIASRGGQLYVGPAIAELRSIPGLGIRSSQLAEHSVATSDAAKMFSMNLETLRHDSAVRSAYDERTLDRIAEALMDLRGSPSTGEITWGMRQVVFEAA